VLKFIAFSAALAMGVAGVGFLKSILIHPYVWLAFTFLLIMALGVHLGIEWVTRKRAQGWVVYYLGIVVSRLLLSVGFLAYFIFSDFEQLYLFIGNYFVLYLFYSGFEIYTLLANLRRNSIS
jgi:hypothetical protein